MIYHRYKENFYDYQLSCCDKLSQPKKKGQYDPFESQGFFLFCENHDIHVREIRLSAGAEFIVAIAGDIMTMPGLPKKPAAYEVKIGSDGNIQGLF